MKLRSAIAAASLAFLGLTRSVPSFALTKAEIDASANDAITSFYALDPQTKGWLERPQEHWSLVE